MIDGDEIAEAARQPFGLDRRGLVLGLGARPDDDLLMLAAPPTVEVRQPTIEASAS